MPSPLLFKIKKIMDGGSLSAQLAKQRVGPMSLYSLAYIYMEKAFKLPMEELYILDSENINKLSIILSPYPYYRCENDYFK